MEDRPSARPDLRNLVKGCRPRNRRAVVLTLAVLLLAHSVTAEEWHEAYRAGVQALARGDARQAVQHLRRAIASRPEPGRNVLTYGTNIEPRYFPYLRLAEAYLALGQLEAAREALQVSAAKNGEPADERQKLEARLDTALEARKPPPPSTQAASPSTPVPATPSPEPTPQPTPVATPPPPGPTPMAAPVLARPRSPSPVPSPRPIPTGPPLPAESIAPSPAAPAACSIEIVSQPPGALAFLDDEPLGPTDPLSGRLVKPNLAAGPHKLRVALAGHEDFLKEIDLAPEGRVSVYATLKAQAPPGGMSAGWLAFGVVALSLTAAVAWMVLRRPASPAPLWAATPRPRSGGGPGSPATPSGNVNPGARRDEQGLEWFGEYRLLEMLGRGGMASVYKAERAGEVSALKRPLIALLDDKEFLERFLREAEIGRALNHPNIVRILSRGNVDTIPYFTMELLPGQTLQAYLASWGAADPRTAVNLVTQVAEALDFAHSKGVIHRDLKPSNIMLLNDGTAKVMDFGIARARRFEGLTATGAFLGTPDYVAPEVIEGGVAEPRSDLYSLGAVFYELLTGRRPFSGETAFSLLQKHVGEEAPAPSRIQPGVPADLDTLVRRLLAKTPAERPASAEELVVALREWLNRVA